MWVLGLKEATLLTPRSAAAAPDAREAGPASNQAHRSGAIDILRAIAVLLVMGRHMVLPPETPANGSAMRALVGTVMRGWNRGGWIGVDLFFVLSGFLVSGLLFREHQRFGRISAKNFLMRRGFKIYPGFWVLIAVTAVVAMLTRHSLNPTAIISELAFVQNYGPALWHHTWSLAVEEHFYLTLLIFLVFLSPRGASNPFRSVPIIFAGVALGELGFRIAITHWLPYADKTHLFPSHLRMDSLFCGVVISYFYHYHSASFMARAWRNRRVLLSLGIALLAPPFIFQLETTPFIPTVGLTLCYLGSSCLMVAALTVAETRHPISRALAYVGSRSYSIYLWHLPVQLWLTPYGGRIFSTHFRWPVYFLSFFAVTILIGILMAIAVEFPMLTIRDRWFPSRGRPLAVSLDLAVRTL
jgi:peptidoglycan/LPS O-acetylase OafA/YrhL